MTEHRADAPGAERARGTDMSLLGIYLNDHLAGATAGTARARSLLRSCRGTALGDALAPVAAEITEDRASLLDIMRRLDVPVRRYKVYAGRAAEQVGRLKSNGSLVRRSPLSTLWELEALMLGVEGKTAGWQTLLELAPAVGRLDARDLDDLVERARRQHATLARLRREQVGVAFRET
ncbi:hypothetical protein KEF29_11925 [Streptomyces tuirus]|uniref:Uncharacterized protein n=1 Tax=Streptomyces tuirus TaxID=68278 RepID=A0A941J2A8_9ACTN|nr:hypothetical protein [Streptomyces tuirus]